MKIEKTEIVVVTLQCHRHFTGH